MADQIYYSVFTKKGLELVTEAIRNGTKLGITSMAFGDGNGSLPVPNENFTKLVKEVHRTQLNSLAPDPNNQNWLRAEAIIASAIGGFNIRELGLYAGNVLVAYSNYPATYKPNPSDGTARIMTFRMILQIDNVANFSLVIDPDVVLATIQYVNNLTNDTVSTTTELKTVFPNKAAKYYVKKLDQYFNYLEISDAVEDNVCVIQSSVANGKWIMQDQNAYYASWFATPNVMVDQSEKLQKGWNYATSKNRKFIFDDVYYVALNERTYSDSLKRKIGLQVPDNSYTEFLEKAAIKVIPNAEPLGYVLNFYLAENFKIYNPTVFGDVDEHLSTLDESNHCFNIVNCKNGYIHKPKAFNAWGDGIYIGTEYASASLKQLENVTVFEPQAEHCGRDCISITSGKNLTIYSPFVKDPFRTLPKAGINIESEGIGVTKSEFINVKIVGSIRAENCDIGLSIQLFDSLHNDVSISIDDVSTKECKASVFTQLFASNSGSVKIGNIYAESWSSAALRCNWSQLNCQLNIGDIHSINALCDGFNERFSSVIALDIDSINQPQTFLGNFEIGNVYIKDTSATKVLHPFYYKDNTGQPKNARPLARGSIGKIFGETRNQAFYADGYVTKDFVFELEYTSAYYLVPTYPYLYSKLNIEASGSDFILNLTNDYRSKLSITKSDQTSAQVRVKFPDNVSLFPLVLNATKVIRTAEIAAKLEIAWISEDVAFITNQIGSWQSS